MSWNGPRACCSCTCNGGQVTGGMQAGAQTHCSHQHSAVGAAGVSLGHRDCPVPAPQEPAKAPRAIQGCSEAERAPHGFASSAAGQCLGSSAASQRGQCLLRHPGVQWGWGQGTYQREVVVAGVVAGALTLWAEALWAQRQAGPPAPAQAEPGGQMGELSGGQFPKNPSLLQGRGWSTKHLPLHCRSRQGRWTCST